MSIFLREGRTRHSILTRQKTLVQLESSPGAAISQERDSSSSQPGVSILVESDDEVDGTSLRRATSFACHSSPDDELSSKDRRRIERQLDGTDSQTRHEDKKLDFRTSYDGYGIFGWVLCLLVTRKGGRSRPPAAASDSTSQALMEEWISTQVQTGLGED